MSSSIQHNDDIESNSGIRLRKRYMAVSMLEKKLEGLDYIPCQHLSTRVQRSIYVQVKKASEWGTIGIIERSIQADDGMLVLRLTNLRNSYFDLFLSDKACERYKDRAKIGTVLGITKPTVLSAEGTVGFHVSHINQVWHIGESLDMGQCEAYVQQNKRCSATIDRRSGEFCDTHIVSVCNVSKNGRMELASGDSGIDIRWTSTSQSRRGQTRYQAISNSTYSHLKKTEHVYSVKGKRMTSEGKEINKKPVVDLNKVEKDKEAWTKFLRGHNDPGAINIRKIKGITDNAPQTALSKEALLKVYNKRMLESDEVKSKKRAIDQILEIDQRKKNKNKSKNTGTPEYIDLD